MGTPTRGRAVLVLIAALVLGTAVQPMRPLPGTDAVGSACYASVAVGLWALLLPRRGAVLPAAIGTGLAGAVELLQLTPVPQRIAEVLPVAGFLLGGVFDGMDLLAMLGGGVLAGLALAGRRNRSPGPAVSRSSGR